MPDDAPAHPTAAGPPRYVLAALRRRRFLVSAWPWRSLAYLVTTAPIAWCVGVGLLVVALPWLVAARDIGSGAHLNGTVVFAVFVAGALAVTVGPLLAVPLAALERARLGLVDARPVASPHRPARGGPGRWLLARLGEAGTWRELAYAVFLGVAVPAVYGALALLALFNVGLVVSPWLVGNRTGPVTVGFADIRGAMEAVPFALAGLAVLPLWLYLFGALAAGQAAVARALIGEGTGDGTALREVARSRARLVDAYEAERARIERDLHDGAQHRLTSLTLQLGMARLDVPDDSPAAGPLRAAHEQAKELMVVLRELIHGIRAQSLTELGLVGAVRELADQSAFPVTVTAPPQWDRAGRLPEPVERTAFFVASEALANVAKHAGATRADLRLARSGRLFVLEVRDDGRGGADPAGGTGLTGLADRVAAVNGRLLLSSPAGGPTLVRVELPWEG